MKLKKDDLVQVMTGKDKNKQGKILQIDRKTNRIIVEGINIVTKHQKPSHGNQTGGIVKTEAAINASNVMFLHKGKPTRLGYKVEEKGGKNVKTRIAKSTGEAV